MTKATITDSKGKGHEIALNKNGTVPVKALKKIDSERSSKARKSDKKTVSRTVYPKNPTVEMAQKWAKNPGSYDVKGVDAPDSAKPSHTVSKSYQYVYDRKGKRHRVPVDGSGNATSAYLEYVNNGRSAKSKTADKIRTAKTVYSSNPPAYMAYDWAKNPRNKDIRGVDAPDDAPIAFIAPKQYSKPKKASAKSTKMKTPVTRTKTPTRPKRIESSTPPTEVPHTSVTPVPKRAMTLDADAKTAFCAHFGVPDVCIGDGITLMSVYESILRGEPIGELIGNSDPDVTNGIIEIIAGIIDVPIAELQADYWETMMGEEIEDDGEIQPGYDDFVLNDGDFDSIIELKDGKVMDVHYTDGDLLDGSVGGASYTIYDHGSEYDGGQMDYDEKQRLSDLEDFVLSANGSGMGFRRIVARSPSDDYSRLSEALMLCSCNDTSDWDRIKGTYGLSNIQPKRMLGFGIFGRRH